MSPNGHCSSPTRRTVREQNVDIAILCELYRNIEESRTWTTDASGRAAIWVCSSHFIQKIPHTQHYQFTWVNVQDTYIYSVYASQLFSGHGCFLAYQERLKVSESDLCPVCDSTVEDAEHIFFVCLRFYRERAALQKLLHQRSTLETIVHQMMSSKENWNAVADYAATIIKKL